MDLDLDIAWLGLGLGLGLLISSLRSNDQDPREASSDISLSSFLPTIALSHSLFRARARSPSRTLTLCRSHAVLQQLLLTLRNQNQYLSQCICKIQSSPSAYWNLFNAYATHAHTHVHTRTHLGVSTTAIKTEQSSCLLDLCLDCIGKYCIDRYEIWWRRPFPEILVHESHCLAGVFHPRPKLMKLTRTSLPVPPR